MLFEFNSNDIGIIYMSLTKKIAINTFSLSSSNFLARFLSFFAVLLIMRGLNLYEYGILTLGMAITGPVASFAGMGLDSMFVADTARYLGEEKFGRAKKLIITFLRNKVLITFLMLAIGWFLRSWLETKYGSIISVYFFWFAIWVVVQSMQTITNLLSQIYEKFIVLSFANVFEVIIKLIVVLIFWKTIGLTIISVLWVYIISKSAAFLVMSIPIWKEFNKSLGKVKADKESVIWEILKRHGKWEMIRNLAGNFTNNIKPWFVKFFLNTEAVAIYSLAQTIYSVISQTLPLRNVILPIVIKRIENRKLSSLIIQKANKYAIYYYLFAIISFFIAGDFLVGYFLPKYLPAVFLIKIMLFALLTTSITSNHTLLLYGLRQQKFLLFTHDAIIILSRISILPLLLWVGGLSGIAFEMIFSSFIVALIMEYYLRKKFEIITWRFKSLLVFDNYDKWFLRKILSKTKSFRRIKKV